MNKFSLALGVGIASVLVSACTKAEFMSYMDADREQRRLSMCLDYIDWKAKKLLQLQTLTDDEVTDMEFYSRKYKAFCDDNPATETTETLESLETLMTVLKETQS